MGDPFIGEIKIFAGNFAPYGWAPCNGQIMQIVQNTALFSVIGNAYGGDGKTTFALPNLQGRAAMCFGNGPNLTPRRFAEQGGTEQVTLTPNQMPAHNHVPQCTAAATVEVGTEAIWAGAKRGGGNMYAAIADTPMSQTALTGAGQSLPHNNMQPYMPLMFIIALQGIFPPRQ